MDFTFTEEQESLKASVIEFARRELNRDVRRRDREGEFSRDAWRACAKFGIQGLPVPKEFGGGGADIVTTVSLMEGLGYACRDNGLIFSLNAQMWSLELPLTEFGTPDQKRRYLPGLVSGDLIGVHAMTEAGSGSDAFSMRTRVERQGNHYVLNGSKIYITNAPVADVVIVFATLKPGHGFASTSAFLVEKDTPGFAVSRELDKMGLRTSPMGEIVLDNCKVSVDNRLGPEGAGMSIFNSSMEWERSCILASAVGAMQRQLETCISYAKTRQQFGQSIGKFQSISNKIADMYLRLEAARLLIYKVAWLKRQGKPALAEAAAAKVFTSEAWVQSCLDAIQIHGAFGYMTDSEIERDLRDSVAGTIYSGTSEIQRMIIARSLGV
ncbi:MAG: acyl-CoA dehydrogenase family protein [Nitrososphaerales archaeon]|jgi:alkylation response protein AidB-like acyl-CoA dehydrogenase